MHLTRDETTSRYVTPFINHQLRPPSPTVHKFRLRPRNSDLRDSYLSKKLLSIPDGRSSDPTATGNGFTQIIVFLGMPNSLPHPGCSVGGTQHRHSGLNILPCALECFVLNFHRGVPWLARELQNHFLCSDGSSTNPESRVTF